MAFAVKWLQTRAIRPPDEPNDNTPGEAAPGTVGPPSATPGDPHGVVADGDANPQTLLQVPRAQPWSGWPAEWQTPWWGHAEQLADTAWACVDLNASVLSAMPPYLVGAPPTLDASWIVNPNPDVYSSWEEFLKQLAWDYQLGEAFVLATAWYATGWPARFHVVPPWAVQVEIREGLRTYRIGEVDVTRDILHLRYRSSVDQAHGTGPLDAARTRLVAEGLLRRYVAGFASSGGIPASILEHPEELTAEQSAALQAQWVQARLSHIGEPAVLSGGVTWRPTQVNPKDAAAVELMQITGTGIAVLFGVPPFLVGLPSGGDSMTYQNVQGLVSHHWRTSLLPKAQTIMSGLSQWALPRGTTVELNRDAYVQAEPLERAQTWQILNGMGVASIDEIRAAERLSVAGAVGLTPTPQEVIPDE
jgi:HK97 family phage portal protein